MHQPFDCESVRIVLPALNERCDIGFQRRPAIIVSVNATFEGAEDTPDSIGHLFDCHLTRHANSPFDTDQTAGR
jgi:hypothetical protein